MLVQDSRDAIKGIMTVENVIWAINTIEPYKSRVAAERLKIYFYISFVLKTLDQPTSYEYN